MEIEKIVFKTFAISAYLCGGSLILKNPNDTDVVLFFKNGEDRINAIKKAPHDTGYNLHFAVDNNKPFLGCYGVQLMKKLYGEEEPLKLDIFDEKTKVEYKELLIKYAKLLQDNSKKWYHILTAVYMYENNSYELTENQKNIIQEVHDKGINEELKKYCIEKLQ